MDDRRENHTTTCEGRWGAKGVGVQRYYALVGGTKSGNFRLSHPPPRQSAALRAIAAAMTSTCAVVPIELYRERSKERHSAAQGLHVAALRLPLPQPAAKLTRKKKFQATGCGQYYDSPCNLERPAIFCIVLNFARPSITIRSRS